MSDDEQVPPPPSVEVTEAADEPKKPSPPPGAPPSDGPRPPAGKPPSRPGSRTPSRPSSRPPSRPRSRPGSRQGSRQGSPAARRSSDGRRKPAPPSEEPPAEEKKKPAPPSSAPPGEEGGNEADGDKENDAPAKGRVKTVALRKADWEQGWKEQPDPEVKKHEVKVDVKRVTAFKGGEHDAEASQLARSFNKDGSAVRNPKAGKKPSGTISALAQQIAPRKEKITDADLKAELKGMPWRANAIKEGELYKQQEKKGLFGGKKWQKRWFILHDKRLYYFEKSDSEEPRGIIHLTKEAELIPEIMEKGKAVVGAFGIRTPQRVWVLKAEEEKWKDQWLDALNKKLRGRMRIQQGSLSQFMSGNPALMPGLGQNKPGKPAFGAGGGDAGLAPEGSNELDFDKDG